MLKRLAADHQSRFEEEAPRLLSIGTEPEFAIGQRALLVQSPAGKRETSNTQQTLVGRRGKPSRAEGFPISSS
jgi:hypothetical protein